MAKATVVTGIDPKSDLASNARRVLRCRLADVIEWLPHILDADDREGLHDFRIAAKRARYALEFLASGLPNSAKPKRFVRAAIALQEALGAVTDSDAHLRCLREAGERLTEAEREGLDSLCAHAESERHTRYEAARSLVMAQLAEGVWADLLRALV